MQEYRDTEILANLLMGMWNGIASIVNDKVVAQKNKRINMINMNWYEYHVFNRITYDPELLVWVYPSEQMSATHS
jgi:hypothetical protein